MSEYIDREAFIADKRAQYCDNCDRRKGVKNGKMRFVYEIGDAPCRACGVGDMMDDIEDYPAADVQEVRHGRWVAESYYAGPMKMWGWKCTACEAFSPVSEVKFYKFCPGCGAKMDGEKDNG